MDNKPNNTTNEYLKTTVMTASPEKLQLMLYDGAIRFCEQARRALQDKKIEESYNLLSRAESIVMELAKSLRDEFAPETCSKMRSLYIFCYEQLVAANMHRTIKPLDDALKVLRHMRETWLMLIEQLKQENAAQSPQYQTEQLSSAMLSSLEGIPVGPIGSTISLEG